MQALLTAYFTENFYAFHYKESFYLFTREPGLHLGSGNNLAGDICLYEKSKLPPAFFITKYLELPPLIQVEMDVSIDLLNSSETTYINKRVSKLLHFGVGKVIWIFTAAESVLVATSNGPWQWMNWNNDIALLDGLTVNIGRFTASLNDEVFLFAFLQKIFYKPCSCRVSFFNNIPR